MTTYGVSESGFTPKSLQMLIQEKTALAKSSQFFGSGVDLSPTSPLKKFIEVISIEEYLVWRVLEDVYYAGYLDTATGKSLDNVVSLLGLTRREAERSEGIVRFYTGEEPIVSGSSIPILSGSIISTPPPNSYEFITVEDGEVVPYIDDEINSIEEEEGNFFVSAENLVFGCDYVFVSELPNRGGTNYFSGLIDGKRIYLTGSFNVGDQVYTSYRPLSLDLQAESRLGGSEYNIGPNQISIIQPFVNSNLLTVSNPDSFGGGADRETDIELRDRAKNYVTSLGRGTVDSIVSAISTLSGVRSVTGIENYGDETENGVPPHSLKLFVTGGADSEIAATIEDYRPAGIYVFYERPTEIPIFVTATVIYSSTANTLILESTIKSAILSYFDSLNPGDDVLYFEIANAISNVDGVFAIKSGTYFIGTSSPPAGTGDVAIEEDGEIAICSADNITLTLESI